MTQDLRIHISADGIATVTSQLDQVNNSIQKVEKSGGFTSFRNGLAMTGLAIDAVVTNAKRMAAIGNYFIDPAAEIEQLKLRLESLYGSFDRGAEAFQTFQDVAAKTPSSLIEVVNAGASLKAFGVDAEKMIAPITDLAAYMGVDVVEAAQSMGRAFAGGQGAADIFRERGVLAIIKSFNGIDDLTKLTLPQFREAMEKTLVDPAGGIAGAADRMSKSYTGALSNMADIWSRVRTSIVSDMTKSLEGGFRSITKSLEDFIASGAAEKMAKQIAQVTEAMLKIISIATRLDYVTVGIGAAFTAATVMVYRYRMGLLAAGAQNAIMAASTFSLSGAIKAATYEMRFFMMALGPVGIAVAGLSALYAYGAIQTAKYKANQLDLADSFEVLTKRASEATEAIIQSQRAQNISVIDRDNDNDKRISAALSGLDKLKEKMDNANATAAAKAIAAKAAAAAASEKAAKEATEFQEQFNQALDDTKTKLNDIGNMDIDLPKSLYDIYIDDLNKRLDAEAELNLSLLQASEAYYAATDNLSQRHIDLQLDIYRQEIQAKYGTALLSMQIDEMVANKRIELNKMATDSIKTENESALDKLVKDNEVASALMTNSVNTISSEFTRMFQIQSKSSNDAVRVFTSFINSMIADIGRLIAQQLVSVALTNLMGAGTGTGGGLFGFISGLFGTKSAPSGNGLSPVVGASQSNQTLTMAINRLNYNLEGGMQNNVNVYVKPRDIARANTVGQMQLVTL